jgi:membrane-associated phospholipid phosphatase
VIALQWEWIAVGYYAYLLLVALAFARFARARTATLAATVACVVVLGAQAFVPLGPLFQQIAFGIVVPSIVLLVGYRLSGLFFTTPMHRVERWLMTIDDRFLRLPGVFAAYEASPRFIRELMETAYLLVYLVIPAAAVTLMTGGHPDALPRFWATVLLAEFVSYGMLPWLQTQSPRALETAPATHSRLTVRRFNVAILTRGSIQVNTVPSGHAAGAAATALAVLSVMPAAGIVFLVLAVAIVVSTVLGRYHYLADSLLGVIVATGAWLVCR